MSTPTSTSTPGHASGSNKQASKATKPSKSIVLRLSPHLLARFPSAQPVRKISRSKPTAVIPTALQTFSEPQTDSVEVNAELDPAPLPSQSLEPLPLEQTPNSLKRKGVPGPKPGSIKRSAPALDANGMPKPRGKPGPKKRIRAEGDIATPVSGFVSVPHHKLGPKANQGAINAGLRALDRTGKPTRKWSQTGFRIKSFTGVLWEIPSWRAPSSKRTDFNGDAKSSSATSSGDAKAGNASSMPSEKSNSGGEVHASGTNIESVGLPTHLTAPDALPSS